jgi:hypothetical protein
MEKYIKYILIILGLAILLLIFFQIKSCNENKDLSQQVLDITTDYFRFKPTIIDSTARNSKDIELLKKENAQTAIEENKVIERGTTRKKEIKNLPPAESEKRVENLIFGK